MNRGQIVAVVLLAVAAGAAGYFVSRHQSTPVQPVVATATGSAELRPVPDFSLVDLTGETRSGAEWSGQVRIVNFWATWCPP